MKHCKNCGNELPRDATRRRSYCNDICRVQFSRSKSVTKFYGDAMNAIAKFSKVKSAQKLEAVESLKVLKRAIDDQLRALGDSETQSRYDMLENRK